MAKISSNMFYVQLGELAWMHEVINRIVRPERRSKEAKELLRTKLAREGWVTSLGIIDTFNDKSKIFKEYKKILEDVYKGRVAEYDRLKTAKDDVRMTCFVQAFCNSKNEIIQPKYIANTCNGRLEEYFDSQVIRVLGSKGTTEEGNFEYDPTYGSQSPVFQVPIQLSVYETEKERVDQQVAENSKLIGNVETTNLQKLGTIQWYVTKCGASQAEMRQKFPGTIGQKGWLLSRLDLLWSDKNTNELFSWEKEPRPNVDLIERCKLKPSNDRYVNFSTLNNVSELIELVARSYPSGLDQKNNLIKRNNEKIRSSEKEGAPKEELKPLTHEELEEYFARGKPATPKKGLKNSTWETFLTNESELLKEVAKAQISGNVDPITNKLIVHSDVYNEVYKIIEDGKKTEILMALSIINHPLFQSVVEHLLSDKTFELKEVPPPDNEQRASA